MSSEIRGTCCTPTHATGADAPGVVWSERVALSNAMQEMLNSKPVIRLTASNEISLDMRDVQSRADSPTLKLLERFRQSLKNGFDISEWTSPLATPSLLDTSAHGVANGTKKRKLPVDENENVKDVNKSLFSRFKLISKRRSDDPCSSGIGVTRKNVQNSACRAIAEPINCMCVPVGVSPSDRVTLYDSKNKMLTRMYIDMPMHCYEGMRLANLQPEPHFKQLLVDGEGYKAGDTAQQQHACRLYVHRKLCTNGACSVLGCGFDPAYSVFENAATKEQKMAYEKHWKTSRKTALRVNAQSFKAKTCSMK